MDRKLISRRIGSILDDISRLNNALYAMDTTDIQRYPDNYDRATALEGIGYNILSMPARQWSRINQLAA